MILERVTNGNGAGELLVDHYVNEASWYSFNEVEQDLIRKTAMRFTLELRETGFLDPEHGAGEGR